MRVRVTPGAAVTGATRVPGDKSVAHRWLILAATARGRSRLAGLPTSLDVRSTASCLAAVTVNARPGLDLWTRNVAARVEDARSTWNPGQLEEAEVSLEVDGDGTAGLTAPADVLDCGNSGTSMRLLAGLLAGSPFRCVLRGDESLSGRPMERVAVPLRLMGANVATTDGHPPLEIEGGHLGGIDYEVPVPSAQVKGGILLAAIAADGTTIVRERAATRDHTERAMRTLGAPIRIEERSVAISGPFGPAGFEARVPGDPSSAAFLVAAAALTGSELLVHDVGLNPSRLRFLEVLDRMGVHTETTVLREELGEPVGDLRVAPGATIVPIRVREDELPLIVDEVPVLALVAAHAPGDSWFFAAGELRVKESDRLRTLTEGIRGLGGHAADEGDDLVIAGGGLAGGRADARGDHRIAMALAVGSLASRAPCEIDGMEAAAVSYPGFVAALRALGANLDVLR
jgi:3-phosphoshikimate 1-carboxyvinyltransferase